MQIKKFEAPNMTEALELVKRQLGSDAVILSSKKVRRGGFGILGKPIVEITAATDPDYSSYTSISSSKKKEGYNKAPLLDPMQKDIEELKLMIWSLARNNLPHMITKLPEDLLCFYRRLTRNGVEEELALKIIGEARENLSEEEFQRDENMEERLTGILKNLFNVSGPLQVEGGKQKVIAFIGPTGVGKTTTIAKIAAKQVLEEKRKVALITLDTYRIAAIEQLKIYARIIGIPVEVVLNRGELQKVIKPDSSNEDKNTA